MSDQPEPTTLTDAAGKLLDDAKTMTDPTSPPATDTEPDDDGKRPGNREAAKYRARLRDTEQQLAGAAAATEAAQRQLVDHLAATHRIKPAGLWASGATLADLLDADGNVDPKLVEAACTNAIDTLGLQRRVPRPDPSQGRGGNPGRGDWASAFIR